ncbi:MAG: hypothetical protein ABEJ65_06785 [bacterium]
MKNRVTFWTIFIGIILLFSVLGLGIVPNWPRYFQTPEQRYEYLIQSIWCPI